MPRIPDNLLRSVIYLYRSAEEAQAGDADGGTGFLVSVPSEARTGSYIYGVTAGHVIRRGATVVRVNKRDGTSAVLPMQVDDWEQSREDDLAVISLGVDAEMDFSSIPIDMFLTPEISSTYSIGPGDEVFMCGRFLGQAGVRRNEPSVRFGSIAQMSAPASDDRGLTQQGLLVEMHSLSGFSGSPVLVYVDTTRPRPSSAPAPRSFYWGLLGVDWAHVHYEEPLRDAHGEIAGDEYLGVRVRLNAGMARVVPAWRLRLFLYSDDFVIGRREADDGVPIDLSVPTSAPSSSSDQRREQ